MAHTTRSITTTIAKVTLAITRSHARVDLFFKVCFYSLGPVTRHIRGSGKSIKRSAYSSPSVNDESTTFLSRVVISKELSVSMFRGRTVARKFKKPALLASVLLRVKTCILEFIASNSSSVSQTTARAWLSPFIGSISIVRHETVYETVRWRNRLNTLKLTRESADDLQSLHVLWNYRVTIIARRSESSFNRPAITRFFCLKDRDKKNLCCFVCTFKKTVPRTVVELDISFTIGFIITATVLIARKERVFFCGL